MEKMQMSEGSRLQSSWQTWLPLFCGAGAVVFLLVPLVPARITAHWISLTLSIVGVLLALVVMLRVYRANSSFAGTGKIFIGLTLCLFMTAIDASGFYVRHLIEQSNNVSPISVLRNLHGAQASFSSRNGRFATVQELADENLIDRYYASGKPLQGYLYSSTDVSRTTYCIHADRAPGSTSPRDFNITEEGVVRFIESPVKGTVPHGAGTPINLNNEE